MRHSSPDYPTHLCDYFTLANRMRHLEKEESRQHYQEIRTLWNEWDPIGISPGKGGPLDEYDSYLGPSLRLLEQGASTIEIKKYLSYIVGEYMGLGDEGLAYYRPQEFALKLQAWFAQKREGTHV